MISSTNLEITFDYVCPNGETIVSYVKYNGCRNTKGKFVNNVHDVKQCTCPSGQCGSTDECGSSGTVGGGMLFIAIYFLFCVGFNMVLDKEQEQRSILLVFPLLLISLVHVRSSFSYP